MYSLPASIKRIGSKTTEKRWRHSFYHYKSMGAICCQPEFWSNLPQKPYASFSSPQRCYTKKLIKVGQLASKIFNFKIVKFSSLKGKKLQTEWSDSAQNQNSTQLLCLSWLPATLIMIRSNLNELAWRHHFPITSLWEIFLTLQAANCVVSGPTWPKFELVRDFMHVFITCNY